MEKELDYQDDKGNWHIMCACGHTVSGSVKPGDRIALCPNCRFLLRFKDVPIVYQERIPLGTMLMGIFTSILMQIIR